LANFCVQVTGTAIEFRILMKDKRVVQHCGLVLEWIAEGGPRKGLNRSKRTMRPVLQ
jgi:hypothetical protein